MLNFFLFPFALLYDLVTRVRNFLYDHQIFESKAFIPHIISVGNLTVGGTGKTPHVEYLIQLLADNQSVAMLSRGYGRKTKGVIIANKESKDGAQKINPQTIGDEPMQIFSKFGKQITVAVGEKRAKAIPQILAYQPHTEAIILDDAYQHRAVIRHLNLLLSDYYRPFYTDFALPMGRLRERRAGAKRADIIIVSKCPENLQTAEKEEIKKQILRYAKPNTPIFFTGLKYGEIKKMSAQNQTVENSFQTSNPKIILLTGIANTTSLLNYLKEKFQILQHFEFADHFAYTESTVNQIIVTFKELNQAQPCAILTTEKDSVKLVEFEALLADIPVYYLPIEVCFLENESDFKSLILKCLVEKMQK